MAPDGEDQRTDTELVVAVLDGERQAYAVLVERHQHRVFRILLRFSGNTYDAEELSQEVFVKTYLALPSYRPAHKFSSWLYRIATNHAYSYLRRRRHDVSIEPTREGDDGPHRELRDARDRDRPDVAVERQNRAALLWQAVDALPPDFRDIVLMRHLQELSYAEICEATGLPMGTVKSRLARARKGLKRRLAGLL